MAAEGRLGACGSATGEVQGQSEGPALRGAFSCDTFSSSSLCPSCLCPFSVSPRPPSSSQALPSAGLSVPRPCLRRLERGCWELWPQPLLGTSFLPSFPRLKRASLLCVNYTPGKLDLERATKSNYRNVRHPGWGVGGKITDRFRGLSEGRGARLGGTLGQQSLGQSATLGRGQVSPDGEGECSGQVPGLGASCPPCALPSSHPEVPPPFPWFPPSGWAQPQRLTRWAPRMSHVPHAVWSVLCR